MLTSDNSGMACELSELKAQRDDLRDAVRSGVQSISLPNGQTTTFARLRDMRAILADLERQIAECEGSAAKKPRWSTIMLNGGV